MPVGSSSRQLADVPAPQVAQLFDAARADAVDAVAAAATCSMSAFMVASCSSSAACFFMMCDTSEQRSSR